MEIEQLTFERDFCLNNIKRVRAKELNSVKKLFMSVQLKIEKLLGKSGEFQKETQLAIREEFDTHYYKIQIILDRSKDIQRRQSIANTSGAQNTTHTHIKLPRRFELSLKSSNEIPNVQELLGFLSKDLSAIEVMSPVHSGRGTARVPPRSALLAYSAPPRREPASFAPPHATTERARHVDTTASSSPCFKRIMNVHAATSLTSQGVRTLCIFYKIYTVLLSTALLNLTAMNSVSLSHSPRPVRALIYQGSQVTLISESCVQRLGLQRYNIKSNTTVTESMPDVKPLTKDEIKCEEIFVNTHTRDNHGKYTDTPPLGDSRTIALNRFYKLEKSLERNPSLRAQYSTCIQEYLDMGHMEPVTETTGVSPGRPQKSFEDSSERSKRRRTEDLRSKDVVELTYATHMKLRHVGKVAASKVVKDLSKSPQRAKKYVKAFKKSTERQDQPRQLSPLQALSMFTEAELTKAQYERVRETNPNFFPCYSVLQKVKKDTYPEIHRVTETCAEVLVQNLMDHTASRLIQHLGEAAEGLNEEEKRSLILISKWGCDGSQQVQYKMKFDCEDDSDANIFQTSVVPLQLIYRSEKKILWQNPTPSSPRYCRPIRIRFVKETTDVTNEEINYIQLQISALSSTNINDTSIKHKMLFTMVDGKVCNAATHTKSTMRCYICDATVSEFNDLSKERPCKKENFSFGLSLLHARIRFFESILHVAYSNGPSDPLPLTAGHFLIGEPLASLPEYNFASEIPTRLCRWQLMQQAVQHFWKRWSVEYLQQLQPRNK
ncbi:hypothetical protein ACJJTC_007990 [Scirpophaga incertulas]